MPEALIEIGLTALPHVFIVLVLCGFFPLNVYPNETVKDASSTSISLILEIFSLGAD